MLNVASAISVGCGRPLFFTGATPRHSSTFLRMFSHHTSPVLVTGASGFIGGRIAMRLLADGRRMRLLARRPLPEFEERGVEVILGDLEDRKALDRACLGVETIFHAAGKVGVWGPAEEFHRVNVLGTRNLISAARQANVRHFIFTSSPSVVYNGGHLREVDESVPLCTRAPCAYPTSKAAAELEVRHANSATLRTVALRPHLVWGPGDRNLVPRILALAREGKLKIVGDGLNQVDLTYITNVVEAHLLAENALRNPQAPAAGNAYFITNAEPLRLWEWINYLLHRMGIPEVKQHVSLTVAYWAGAALELKWRLKKLSGDPPMTRFVAKELAKEHYFNINAARRDLGYHPIINLENATNELVMYYRAGNAY